MYYVYKITNKINGKIYVGKTGNPKVRWKKHCKIAKGLGSYGSYKKYAIHLAIQKYGVDNFIFEIVSTHFSEQDAYEAEIKTILKSNSIKNGYNISSGGKSGGSGLLSAKSIFLEKDILFIFEKYFSGSKPTEIARLLKCSKTTIYKILDRETYFDVDVPAEHLSFAKKKRRKKKTAPSLLNVQEICDLYLQGLSYRELASRFNSSTFTISKIVKNNIDQEIISSNHNNKKIDPDFGKKIVVEYLDSDKTAQELAKCMNTTKHVVYGILSGRTYEIPPDLKYKLAKIKKRKMIRYLKYTEEQWPKK